MAETEAVKVGIIMGSDSDWPAMKGCAETLKEFGVPFEVRILSAHRTPEETAQYAKTARERGLQVIIAAAGMAAHLAGVIAAHSTLPVIGVPMASGTLQGIDALLSTVQMPPGIPVATVGIGASGALNAALLAVEIMATADESLAKKREQYQVELAKKAKQKNEKLQEELH
ncbi:MAG: 5-(carboxyamino)imidazole ribonucleotide mutase [Sedimentisphaerales bacterium]|nr:5-(carboxyamino)imidazole ribonucleotide mutase [Sedimentisphaerales bacterium]